MKKEYFNFIDLFSGIGAFHLALKSLGGKCVFASEIDKNCVSVYKENFNMNSECDITTVDPRDIPAHKVLCGGFPCQAFSKAGKQGGINDARGTLFFNIAKILEYHHTQYIILENVRNLISHDHGKTWATIKDILYKLGYRLTDKPIVLSPFQFGVPQSRDRVFILGKYEPENVDEPLKISLPKLLRKDQNSIYNILDEDLPSDLTEYEEDVLNIWEDFYEIINEKIIGFPVWSDTFNPKFKKEFFSNLESDIPDWKQEFIAKNIELYLNNKENIDQWFKKYNFLTDLKPSHRKFEWQCGEFIDSIFDGVIQFRPSGIRVKKPDVFPALVAIVQNPIVGKYKRHLTARECARLQSFPETFYIDQNDRAAFKQFGNSANVKIINFLAKELLKN